MGLNCKARCICRASEPAAGEVGFVPPHGDGLHLELQASLVAFSLPLAVGLPLVLFHLPAQGPKPSPRAQPQGGTEAGGLGDSHLQHLANALHPELLFLFCKTDAGFGFYLGEKGGL